MIAPSEALMVRSTSDILEGVSVEFIATFVSEPVYTTTASANSTLRNTEPRSSSEEAVSGCSTPSRILSDPEKLWMCRLGGSKEIVPTTAASSLLPSACATSRGGSRSLRFVSPSMFAVSTYATPLAAEEVSSTASAGSTWRSRSTTRSPTRRSLQSSGPFCGARASTFALFSARSERYLRRSSYPSLRAVRISTKTSTPEVLHEAYGVTQSCGALSPMIIATEITK
mmetsp:Transcript_21803/g.55334  ORF Transcript_21803/g.55334 Transcript_21803/m.55334 type:complete len:227 (+) Transcript_21803:278-958(+)